MAVQFAQPYRFSGQQFARMADAGIIPRHGAELVDGVPYRAGAPIRFSCDDYERLGESGVLHEDERVELIHGEVIKMAAVGGRHSTCVFDVDDYLDSVVGPNIHVVMQSDLRLEESTPVPDVMLLRRADEVRGKVPTAAACMLVVEVADSSALDDRTEKRELYARAGIPEYWVLDLNSQSVVLHLHPVGGDYQAVSEHRHGSSFASPALGVTKVHVADLLR
jgi:Uma2 family endonuclease